MDNQHIEKRIESLEREVSDLRKRNLRVEADKKWETSWMRRVLVAVLTYFVIVLFFWVSKLGNSFVNAIVPTIGFILSTLSMSLFRKMYKG